MNELNKEDRIIEKPEFHAFQGKGPHGREELLRLIFECAPDAYYVNDLKGTLIDGNTVAEELTGYKKEELVGKSFLKTNLLPIDQIPKAVSLLARNALGQATGPDEFVLNRKEGTQVTVEIRTYPVKFDNETLVLGLARDITKRKQSEEVLRERATRLELIARVGQRTTAILELDELLHEAVNLISGTFRYYNVIILLVEGTELVLKAATLSSLQPREGKVRLRIGSEGITGWVARCGEPLIVPDVRLDGRYYAALKKMETQSEIAVPIKIKEKVIGVLDAQSKSCNAFSEIDIFTLQTLADQLAVAIENARLYERTSQEIIERTRIEEALRKSRRKIEALHTTARRLEACQSEDEVYHLTIDAAEKILAFSMCTLTIVDGNTLMTKATSLQVSQAVAEKTNLDGKSLAGTALRTGETIVFGKGDEVPETWFMHKDTISGIGAPIGDIGVFQAASKERDAFSSEDVNLLEVLLGHVTEAVRNIRLRNELREQANHDPLTGVYNRRYFTEAIRREVLRSQRYEHSIGFLMIDVDRFKMINDTYGHQTGDRVLQEVAQFLRAQVRAAEIVVRYGGDEFLIVVPELKHETMIMKQRIKEALTHWNKTNAFFDFPITVSIGDAHWDPSGSASLKEVLAAADTRMYEDKNEHTQKTKDHTRLGGR